MDQRPEDISLTERRSKPRIHCDYPAIIRGHEKDGRNYEESGRVINLSASGIFVLLSRSVQNGSLVSIKIALPTGNLDWGTSRLAISGVVLRGKSYPDCLYGIAIKILHYRF
jgi:hypothetical protein